jgi:hypothetical protein
MRLPTDSLLFLLLLVLTPVAALGPTCFKVVAALVGRPGHLFKTFQTEICERGCQPTILHWDLWTRNNSFVPAVRSLMKRMDIPHKEDALLKMGDDVAIIIKDRCAPLLHGRHICSDPDTLADFGNCFKSNFVKASIKHLPILLPMASESGCKEQYKFLQGDELWDVTIPNNMRDYASVCDKLAPPNHEEL